VPASVQAPDHVRPEDHDRGDGQGEQPGQEQPAGAAVVEVVEDDALDRQLDQDEGE
jgi:hypothetical protein